MQLNAAGKRPPHNTPQNLFFYRRKSKRKFENFRLNSKKREQTGLFSVFFPPSAYRVVKLCKQSRISPYFRHTKQVDMGSLLEIFGEIDYISAKEVYYEQENSCGTFDFGCVRRFLGLR
jgi:hypothetical protein